MPYASHDASLMGEWAKERHTPQSLILIEDLGREYRTNYGAQIDESSQARAVRQFSKMKAS
jgi:hypothetical protein